ncbi:MAG TPA: hypothetical protein VGD77_00050 [Gemmatimonadaceae bacterium]
MRRLSLALCCLLLLAPSLSAQRRGEARLVLALPELTTLAQGPAISASQVLVDATTRELVRSGFPAQLHFRLELWRTGGWFDDLERTVEWDMVVGYDAAAQAYRVRRRYGNQTEELGSFASITGAQMAIERPFRVPVSPRARGRKYYYNLSLDVEVLSVSDLDQLEQWMRGELRPAVRGKNNPVAAVGTGVRTLVSRVLGGERRHYEARSGTFRVP